MMLASHSNNNFRFLFNTYTSYFQFTCFLIAHYVVVDKDFFITRRSRENVQVTTY